MSETANKKSWPTSFSNYFKVITALDHFVEAKYGPEAFHLRSCCLENGHWANVDVCNVDGEAIIVLSYQQLAETLGLGNKDGLEIIKDYFVLDCIFQNQMDVIGSVDIEQLNGWQLTEQGIEIKLENGSIFVDANTISAKLESGDVLVPEFDDMLKSDFI